MKEPETKEFSTAAIASLSTGILLCKFADMHEAAEYLMGHPIWTHQFCQQKLWQEFKAAIAKQYPEMPTEGVTENNYLQKLIEIEAKVGKTVRIRKGSERQ